MSDARKVLILGADGFIGRHLAFGLRDAGWEVLACARRTERLARMGFETLKVDLAASQATSPTFWKENLKDVSHIVNSAGVLNASDAVYKAVHFDAPSAIYTALPQAKGILISAVGIDDSETAFAQHRRKGEALAEEHGLTILRAGLVLADTSYGGSSLARALAALPFMTPVVGDGAQAFNPIHAGDLAHAVNEMLHTPPPPGPQEIGGPETLSQIDMVATLRRWMGLPPTRVLKLPLSLARIMGKIGDAMRWGPISATAVEQLSHGVVAKTGPAIDKLAHPPRGFSQFLFSRPVGTQDLWHARLYQIRPFLRVVLGLLWLISGVIGLTLPAEDFLPLVQGSGLSESALVIFARASGIVDLAIAGALFRGWRPKFIAGVQATMVLGYTAAFTFLAPALWLLPLGGLLKNLPILALIAVMAILEEER